MSDSDEELSPTSIAAVPSAATAVTAAPSPPSAVPKVDGDWICSDAE